MLWTYEDGDYNGSVSIENNSDDIKYDAEYMNIFTEQLTDDVKWYMDRARALERSYVKYHNNETFVGQMAEHSKRFIYEVQGDSLHIKNLELKKDFLYACSNIEEKFKEQVDSSPKARVSISVLLKIKKDFGTYYAVIDTKGYEIECHAKRLVDMYGKWGISTIPCYRRSMMTYEEFCGSGAFLDTCIKKLENFDQESCSALNGKDFIGNAQTLQAKINNTAGVLDSMIVYHPNMTKNSVGLVGLSVSSIVGAIAVKSAMLSLNGNGSTITKISHDKVEKYSSKWNIELGDEAWTTADIVYWKTLGGNDFLFKKKANYVKKYNEVIKDAAKKYDIPEKLLAGVVFNEYGGDPLWIDDVAYTIRDFDWSGDEKADEKTITKKPELTSFGNLSLQVRRVAEMYGYDPDNLTSDQAKEIINDLKDPVKSTYIAAAHLSDLKDIDYADVPPEDMDDNMIRDVATRYNRGPDLSLDEIHKNTSYGNSIFKHEEEIMDALEG